MTKVARPLPEWALTQPITITTAGPMYLSQHCLMRLTRFIGTMEIYHSRTSHKLPALVKLPCCILAGAHAFLTRIMMGCGTYLLHKAMYLIRWKELPVILNITSHHCCCAIMERRTIGSV